MQSFKSVFFVGIKGVAMANLARICMQMGKRVSGSDVSEVFITDAELSDITITTSFEADALPRDVDLLVYSAAHGGENNPQVKEARVRGVNVVHQAAFIAHVLKEYRTSIAVAGCHGKTTTSALLAYALSALDEDPGYMVGVSGFNNMVGGSYGKQDYFVLEADEYGLNPPVDKTPKFLLFHPTHAIVTNIDFDHPDVFDDLDQTKKAFIQFLAQVKNPTSEDPRLILCHDDPTILKMLPELPIGSYLTYGTSPKADVVINAVTATPTGTTYTLKSERLKIHESFTISLFGDKNVLNATAVIAMLRLLNFSLTQIQAAIQDFTGAKRRFELIETVGESYLFDDYAHHPEEIRATISAARSRFPKKRVVVIFQPHTYTRTQSLQNDFVHALSSADLSLVAPIFGSAREKVNNDSITSKDLEKLSREHDINHIFGYTSKEELLADLVHHLKRGDIIFTMGAGDIYKLSKDIVPIIKKTLS